MAGALEDPGKSKIGRVCVSVYHATNEVIGLVKSRRSKEQMRPLLINAESERPAVLVTNDDGIYARGLEVLLRALQKEYRVLVVAP